MGQSKCGKGTTAIVELQHIWIGGVVGYLAIFECSWGDSEVSRRFLVAAQGSDC